LFQTTFALPEVEQFLGPHKGGDVEPEMMSPNASKVVTLKS